MFSSGMLVDCSVGLARILLLRRFYRIIFHYVIYSYSKQAFQFDLTFTEKILDALPSYCQIARRKHALFAFRR